MVRFIELHYFGITRPGIKLALACVGVLVQVPEGEFFWRKIEGIVKLKSGSALVPFWRGAQI